MATNTYVALDTKTLGTATASVTFTSIPQGYTDLVLVMLLSGSGTNSAGISARFNGDSGSNYSDTSIFGNGTTATSGRNSNVTGSNISIMWNGVVGSSITQIMNYSNTTTNKTIISRRAQASWGTDAIVSLWRNTAAINSIEIYAASNMPVGSTFTIYGVAAASVGAKATGGTIYQDSTHFYHVFAGNGTFTPTQSITADCLVVAGGGGGGANGGGGGAGGLLGFTSQSLTATGYTVTVGSGGAVNTVGGDSQFGGLTLVKGGGRGGSDSAGGNGGSGGAASAGGLSGGTATSGQGYNGGVGSGTIGVTEVAGGGGGGAGQATPLNASSNNVAANGGIGSSTYSSWGTVTGIGQNVDGTYYLAGGGGGSFSIGTFGGSWTSGTRGIGGYGGGGSGGTGAANAAGGNGTPNTGGGGGAGKWSSAGSIGGSGVVIVRYAK